MLQFDRHSNFKHGLKLSLGLGFLEHKIRIQDDSRSAIQFFGTFGLGLDRLTNGFCTSGFVGYEFKSNNGKINFYSGFESILGFTQNRRAWNYDTAISEAGINRKDLLLQFKIGWYLPFFFERHSETIEY
ncbi:MAG: hypothetical protein ABIO44_02390 [Saprospiraceae bacterium]